jgi:putative peptidoglycan lipid II flippase
MRFFKRCCHTCRLWSSRPIATVGGAALLLAIAGAVSRVFGLIRDRILASTFGAGDVLDIYYASFRIPDLLYGLLVLGALSAAFIPVFTRIYTKKSPQEAWKLTSDFLTLLLTAIALIGGLLFLFMSYVIVLVAPGFEGEKRDMTILFTRIMLLSPILLGASAVFGGVLIARGSFLAYSLAPIFYNIGIIFGATVLVEGMGVSGLAWGVVLGAALHCIVQWSFVRKEGYRFTFHSIFVWKNPELRRILRLMIPQIFSVASNQINFWIITLFASIMASGSLAVFMFANNLQSLPLALIGISFAVAAFPKLSTAASSENMQEFSRVFFRTLRRILYFILPLSLLFILLRAQIVRVVLGSGVFDWEDTVLTYQVLGILALSLFAQSLLPLLSRAFYSMEDTKTPFFIALFAQAINVIVVALTFNTWGVYALALAFSISSVAQIALLFAVLKKRLHFSGIGSLEKNIGAILLATFLMGLSVQAVKQFWGDVVTDLDTFWEIFLQLIFAGGTGIGVYFLVSHWLHIEEFHDFQKKVYLRIFRRPSTLVASREEHELGER